ncbi:hypothetical protein ADUPG1_000458 [Aduncisulcus paluster]|uniref:MYND-type domain-containing protein n=1 Tax=Aduncisulcus paluster TaxID=2918883 RepID=A0ABQ5K6F2_9EUKA|nr:hypothetical protein ADUPG1_000458 [Aduncisulcus paluster]
MVIPEPIQINPLSFSKGTKRVCKLCGKGAKYMCPSCRVVFYCSKEHHKTDYIGVHSIVCSYLAQLRGEPPEITSEAQRKDYEEKMRKIKEKCRAEAVNQASAFLSRQEYVQALPGARLSLSLARELFDPSSPQLVPAYLQVGEAAMGRGYLELAETALASARWIILQHSSVLHTSEPVFSDMDDPKVQALVRLRGKLHRQTGKLHAFQKDFKSAIIETAHDTYLSALSSGGPDSAHTAVAFCHLGNLFLKTGENKKSVKFFDKAAMFLRKALDKTIFDEEEFPLEGGEAAEPRVMLERLAQLQKKNGDKERAGKMFVVLGCLALVTGTPEERGDAYSKTVTGVDILREVLDEDSDDMKWAIRCCEYVKKRCGAR